MIDLRKNCDLSYKLIDLSLDYHIRSFNGDDALIGQDAFVHGAMASMSEDSRLVEVVGRFL